MDNNNQIFILFIIDNIIFLYELKIYFIFLLINYLINIL